MICDRREPQYSEDLLVSEIHFEGTLLSRVAPYRLEGSLTLDRDRDRETNRSSIDRARLILNVLFSREQSDFRPDELSP